jgi:hypothetical protein
MIHVVALFLLSRALIVLRSQIHHGGKPWRKNMLLFSKTILGAWYPSQLEPTSLEVNGFSN